MSLPRFLLASSLAFLFSMSASRGLASGACQAYSADACYSDDDFSSRQAISVAYDSGMLVVCGLSGSSSSLQVSNMLGMRVFSANVSCVGGCARVQLFLPRGMYIVRAQDEAKRIVVK